MTQLILTLFLALPPTAQSHINTVAAYTSTKGPLARTVALASNVGCMEASHNWKEVQAVLSVAVNRSNRTGESLYRVLSKRHQFATRCPKARLHSRHRLLAAKAAVGALKRPEWMTGEVVGFVTPRAWPRVRKTWRRRGWRKVESGRTLHVYLRTRNVPGKYGKASL